MRIPFAVLPLLATLTPFTLADVKFTTPSAGGTLPFGSIDVKWTDGPDAPSLKSLDAYILELVLGSDEPGEDQVSERGQARTIRVPGHALTRLTW